MVKNNVNYKLLQKRKKNSDVEGSLNLPIQNFYLNPEYKDQVFTVLPGQNLTIHEAVIFEPQVIEQQYNPDLQNEIDHI